MTNKGEASAIECSLASVKPFATHWISVDSDSIEGTRNIIHGGRAHVPCARHQHPWRNFRHNCNEALTL